MCCHNTHQNWCGDEKEFFASLIAAAGSYSWWNLSFVVSALFFVFFPVMLGC